MILAYRVFTTIIYPFLFILIYYRKIIKKEDPKRFKEKILTSHFNVSNKKESQLIWFHTASIGEFKSIIPLIENLNNNTNFKFLITTTTLSSGNLASEILKKFKNVEHRYFPLDINFLIERFLILWRPDKILLVDSEIWPNLILNAKRHKIPIALINARLTTKSFKKWMIFPNTARKIFGVFDLFICSNSETKNYLEKLSLKNVHYKGNMKLFNTPEENNIKDINKNFLLNKRFWLAASTHKDEDMFCLKTHLKLKKKFKDIITIIAPRHIDRSGKIKTLSKKLSLNAQILNKNERIRENKEIIIINFFGALTNYFKYAKSVFIGKSIIKKYIDVGGQNPIEAAKLNCKIYHGPYVYNFKEIYNILKKYDISKEINDDKELSNFLSSDLEDPIKEKNRKISEPINNLGEKTFTETIKLLKHFLNNEA